MNRIQVLLLSALLLSAVVGCGAPEAAAPAQPHREPATQSAAKSGESEAPDVNYEPAYPEEVSTEGLDEKDKRQAASHSHGGDEHTHGGETHSHGDAEHGGEDGRGQDGHSHGGADDHEH